MIKKTHSVQQTSDLPLGLEQRRLAAQLDDLADHEDVLADKRVELTARDARCRYRLHLWSVLGIREREVFEAEGLRARRSLDLWRLLSSEWIVNPEFCFFKSSSSLEGFWYCS